MSCIWRGKIDMDKYKDGLILIEELLKTYAGDNPKDMELTHTINCALEVLNFLREDLKIEN